ncbi:SAVED domain-containing protein [Paenarthrobacter sp. PH39-S1]|uniref:SAVED domain-containing protein n=1 Tax=Paenarthrobacter sp. PH39-S1 TaxID=3046204 RepID=UPI0024BB9345|nr:SAVED domain-containing protein [Paenarthrobacter sp. PH39-S1]MDJ0356625.1 SAVED domain-containing protein [Paenarthrobacter sp. PH39-S1]
MTDIIAAHDAADPIFISYRQSDGTKICVELAWLLRAGGIPVWRDKDDLPPGDTEERLRQAIGDGISGGVLVTTPDVVHSEVVKHVEAPLLFSSHKAHESFALGIANAVEREPGKPDYSAPEQMLGMAKGTLSGVDQQPTDRDGLRTLVQKMLWHRLVNHRERVALDDHTFSLSLQTRNTAQVYDRTGSQLDVRVRPSDHERLPSRDGLVDLKDTIGLLPDAVTRAGARRIRIHGGAHLSVAFAVGAALPSSRVGHMEVLDQQGNVWASDGEARYSSFPQVQITTAESNSSANKAGRPAVAAYVDLLAQRSNTAFEKYIEENARFLTSWIHLTSKTGELLDPSAAGSIAAEVAAHIRALSNENGNAEVHLLLRCPFPLAILIGRLTNTLRCVLYEWDDSEPATGDDFRPRYVATLRIRASARDGVIEGVVLGSGPF